MVMNATIPTRHYESCPTQSLIKCKYTSINTGGSNSTLVLVAWKRDIINWRFPDDTDTIYPFDESTKGHNNAY